MIVIGSYSRLLYGFTLDDSRLSQVFTHSGHTLSVSCVAASSHLFASGSRDTGIALYNTKTFKEVGTIARHNGAVTGLTFWKTKHLLSASADGTICIWRTSDWECLFQLEAHTRGVACMALHPSGRMLLTIGVGTKKAKLWNLLTGKCAVVFVLSKATENTRVIPLKEGEFAPFFPRDYREEPLGVKWSPNGNFFAVQWAAQVDVYSASDSTKHVCHSFAPNDRVSSFCWSSDDSVAVGTERGNVFWFPFDPQKTVASSSSSLSTRVKDLCVYETMTVGISSNGDVLLWRSGTGDELSRVSLDDRLTCVACSAQNGNEGRLGGTTVGIDEIAPIAHSAERHVTKKAKLESSNMAQSSFAQKQRKLLRLKRKSK